ncbi:hypothetical protein QCD60_01300 [Pokkaliibacter sp. MBI-7]|nr:MULTISPECIES: hypothetical protein [Pokkaliibacter]MDH2431191.1 hypothetical protein [Pokkaliibacter sp. MBI-7]
MVAQVISYEEFKKRKFVQEREKRVQRIRAQFARAMGMDVKPKKRPSPWH